LQQPRQGLEPRTEPAVRQLRAIEVRHTQDSPALFTRIGSAYPPEITAHTGEQSS
jgi:hypothetical protein